jgi:thioredoxin-related protein
MHPTLRIAATLLILSAPFTGAAQPPAPPAEEVPIYDTTSVGALAVEAASKAASESGRRLMVNFGTNDCAACRVFNDAIYEEPFLSAFYKQFIPVFVDVSPGSPNRTLLERYGIDPAKGLPAVVLSSEELSVAEATKAGEMAAVAGKGKDAVREWFLKRFKKDPGN